MVVSLILLFKLLRDAPLLVVTSEPVISPVAVISPTTFKSSLISSACTETVVITVVTSTTLPAIFFTVFDLPLDLANSETATQAPKEAFHMTLYTLFIICYRQ